MDARATAVAVYGRARGSTWGMGVAHLLLRSAFATAPIVLGLDKRAGLAPGNDRDEMALRDFGLLVGAFALAALAFDRSADRA